MAFSLAIGVSCNRVNGGDSAASPDTAASEKLPAPALRVRLLPIRPVGRDDAVHVEAVLENQGADSVMASISFDIAVREQPRLDLLVARRDSTPVWRSDSLPPPPPRGTVSPRPVRLGALYEARLAPSGSLRATATWRQQDFDNRTVPVGVYLVRATMHVNGRPMASNWESVEIQP